MKLGEVEQKQAETEKVKIVVTSPRGLPIINNNLINNFTLYGLCSRVGQNNNLQSRDRTLDTCTNLLPVAVHAHITTPISQVYRRFVPNTYRFSLSACRSSRILPDRSRRPF